MDEYAKEDLEKLLHKQTMDELRKQLVWAIKNKKEFMYLEKLSEKREQKFDEELINYALDKYICSRKEGDSQFMAKYKAMFRTSWKLLYGQ